MTDLQQHAKDVADRLEQIVFGNVSTMHTFLLARQLLRRIERGELVEVVRCGECKHGTEDKEWLTSASGKLSVTSIKCAFHHDERGFQEYCDHGRRKDNANG